MKMRWIVYMFLCIAAFAANSFAVPQYTIIDLGALDGNESRAYGINNAGQVVGFYGSDIRSYGFLWEKGTMKQLTPQYSLVSIRLTIAYDINDRSQIIGGFVGDFPGSRAFLWQDGSVREIVGTSDINWVRAINNNSQVVGEGWPPAGGFLWEDGAVINLGELNPYDINDIGQIVGNSLGNSGGLPTNAFLWERGTVSPLGTLPGFAGALAIAINNNSQIVGWAETTGCVTSHPFLWQDGSMYDLGTHPVFNNRVTIDIDINNIGQVVGFLYNSSGQGYAFFWQNGEIHDLNSLIPSDSGWVIRGATKINDRSQIVGYGCNPDGQTHAFLLTPKITVPQERQVAILETSDGVFNSHYNIGFLRDSLRIDLAIRLIGVDPGEELKKIWEEGAEKMWSNQYDVIHNGVPYPIVLDVEFVDSEGDATILVVEGEGQYYVGIPYGEWYADSVLTWSSDYRDEAAAHEVGHLLGLYDEYDKPKPGVLDPLNPIIDYTSIMGSLKGAPKERHFQSFLKWLEGKTGYDMVFAESPLWRPGEFGPPVGDGPPIGVYEPFIVTQVILTEDGGLQLIWNSQPNNCYYVYSCFDLISGKWVQEASLISSQGQSTSWTDSHIVGRQKFYRIEMK